MPRGQNNMAKQDVEFSNQGKVQLGKTNITEIYLSNHIPN